MPFPSWSKRLVPVALVWVLPLGAQTAGDLAERLFRSGERAYAAQSYPEAFETWDQLLRQVPDSPFAAEALLRRARHHAQVEGRPDLALPLLDRLRKDHLASPAAPEGLLLRGEILAAQSRKPEDLQEAIAEFNRVVDLFPDHPASLGAHAGLGSAYRSQGAWSRALQNHTAVLRMDPASPLAARCSLEMAEIQDHLGDLPACLKLLQGILDRHPGTPEAQEAAWRLLLRVRHRLQKPPLKSTGPWPEGRQKWLNTPTLLGRGPSDDLFIYQDDTQLFVLKGAELTPVGPPVRGVKGLAFPGPWQVSAKAGLVKEGKTPVPLPPDLAPAGAVVNRWGDLWVADAKGGGLAVFSPEGPVGAIPGPPLTGLAPLPLGGAVAASDEKGALLFLDASGQPRLSVPYGKGLPAPFRSILALASDPTGHVAALVDGDFEGVVLWGPDGTPLRWATFKSLGISGRFRALALDRQGGLLLADRSNDLLLRLE